MLQGRARRGSACPPWLSVSRTAGAGVGLEVEAAAVAELTEQTFVSCVFSFFLFPLLFLCSFAQEEQGWEKKRGCWEFTRVDEHKLMSDLS